MLDLPYPGPTNVGAVLHNLSTPGLYQKAIRRGEGQVGHLGPIVVSNGELDDVENATDPIFGFAVPTECPKVPSEFLDPRSTWSDPAAYDAKAKELAGLFSESFKEFAAQAREEIVAAGPVAG